MGVNDWQRERIAAVLALHSIDRDAPLDVVSCICGMWSTHIQSPPSIKDAWDSHLADELAKIPGVYQMREYFAPADPVNHPPHYTSHPSGVECITITEHMGFCIGNAIKYLWRADEKGNAIEDLEKARWYIDREIRRRGEIQ